MVVPYLKGFKYLKNDLELHKVFWAFKFEIFQKEHMIYQV